MRKRLFTLGVVFLAVFAMAGVAFAQNNVQQTTTVPNIPQSDCRQAGTINYQADDGTAMQVGDIIQHTLSNNVTVCKTIDYFLLLADVDDDTTPPGAAEWEDAIGQGTALPVAAPAGSAFQVTSPAGGAGALDGNATEQVGFLVRGTIGSQIITLTVVVRTIATGALTTTQDYVITFFGNDPADLLTIRLFDEKMNTGIFIEDDDLDGNYETGEDIEASDNVLCVNTSLFSGEYVLATPDSIVNDDSYRLTFSGDYTIAHILEEVAIVITAANKEDCQDVPYGWTVDQYGAPVNQPTSFDPGDYLTSGICTDDRWSSVYTCGPTEGNGVMISRPGGFELNVDYTITLTLLLNGATSPYVTWAPLDPIAGYVTNATSFNACADVPLSVVLPGLPAPPPVGGVLTISNVNFGASYSTIVLDLPFVMFTAGQMSPGDVITVRVNISKFPCETATPVDLCLGTMVESCSTPTVAMCYNLSYPYATAIDDPDYFVGIVLTNLSAVAGTATVTVIDNAGGMGTFTVSLSAYGQFIDALANVTFDAGSTLDTSLPGQITIVSTVNTSGVCIIGSLDGTFGLYGYKPDMLSMSPCP